VSVLRTRVATGEEWIIGNGMLKKCSLFGCICDCIFWLGRLDILQILHADVGLRNLLLKQ
jgi:hypothetical protein